MSAGLPITATALAVALSLGVLGGCSWAPSRDDKPPVQEMSDARQALRAAHQTAGAEYASDSLATAERLLDRARRSLAAGDYSRARREARLARSHAIAVREAAMSLQQAH